MRTSSQAQRDIDKAVKEVFRVCINEIDLFIKSGRRSISGTVRAAMEKAVTAELNAVSKGGTELCR